MSDEAQVITARVDRALTAVGRGRSTGGRLQKRTLVKYRRHQAEWEQWRRPRGYPNAATSEALAVWAGALLQRGYAKESVKGRLNAVKALCRERGWPVPDGVAAWSVLRGDDLTPGGAGKVNTPLARRAELLAVVGGCDTGRAAGVREWCLATLAYDILANPQELIGLDIEHVTPTATGLLVNLGGPAGLRVDHDHAPADLCPVCATVAWLGVLRRSGATRGPLFRPIDKGGNIAGLGPIAGHRTADGRLNPRGFQKIWRRCMVRVGLVPVPPRMLRLGGAADDVAAGAGIVATLRRGRWSRNTLPMVARLVAVAEDEGEAG